MDEQKNSDVPADDILDFTDRELILERFEQILRSAVPGRFRVLAVKGNSGTGKTTLIRYLEEQICPQFSWQSGTVHLEKSVPTFRSLLDAIGGALAKCVTSSALREYREKRDTHIKSYQSQLKPTINASQSMDAHEHSSVNTTSRI